MPCERKARFRHNTIAFWLSDEERAKVNANIALSGLHKGDYYRKCVLGQQVQVSGNRYQSAKLAATLETIYQDARMMDKQSLNDLVQILSELLMLWKEKEGDAR